jgi:hypothetical protein
MIWAVRRALEIRRSVIEAAPVEEILRMIAELWPKPLPAPA